MAYLDYIRLAVDGGMFAALVVLAMRVLRATAPQINHLKLVELDASLKALVKEADSASRSLNDQLLKRQKNLEQLLFDIQTSEGRMSRLITTCEEQKGILDLRLSRAQSIARTMPSPDSFTAEPRNMAPVPRRSEPAPRAASTRIDPRDQRIEVREEERIIPPAYVEPAVEPPSFEQTATAPSAERGAIGKASALSRRVERVVEATEKPRAAAPDDVAAWKPGAQGAFSHIAESAERVQRTTQEPEFIDESIELMVDSSLEDSYAESLSEMAAQTTDEDPRLGVLAGKKLSSII